MGASASRCAFPSCTKKLVAEKTNLDPAVILGEMAHIVGESEDGPRGKSPLTLDERNPLREPDPALRRAP